MTFKTTDLTPLIETSITADKAALLDGSNAQALRALLEERGVLIFPRADLSDEEQRTFARTIGTPTDQGERGLHKISLDEKVTASARYLKGTVLWHFDGWNDPVPALGTVLSARVLSSTGGQTEFSNTYAAYEELPAETKARISGLKVAHTMMGTQRGIHAEVKPEMEADWENFAIPRHPLVWTHRSGRRSLLLGSSADWIEGLDSSESDTLLAELKAWASQPRYVYRHEWQVGDVVLWDNCGVLHRVEPYPMDSGRVMHRVTLEGEEAIT
ncbi:alpha-ketoglutarate-dependent taurine dioxygenase [Novosphingobium sp. PhB165]|nr:alpha-ketoglutarate-dependent taurine dioxygenase [Novosphingobium sp. PhB165]